MNLNQFHDENNIVDPNLQKSLGTQGNSTEKRIVTPQQMGFTHEEPQKIARPEQPILDDLEKAIARKQNEARLMADAIEESDGEGVSEEEFQDLLKNTTFEDDGIPSEEELVKAVLPNKTDITTLATENPASNLLADLEAEDKEDEADYKEESKNYEKESVEEEPVKAGGLITISAVSKEEPKQVESTVTVSNNPFSNFESGDINFDEESEELEENIDEQKAAEKEQKEQMEKLRTLVREKIRPVSQAFDISTFSISKRPASSTISTPRTTTNNIADWVLMSSQRPIYMKKFNGTEIERLSNGGKGRSRLNRALDTWQLIYSHIADPHKPASLEEWAKCTSFLDIDHIYMAIYRANFEGSNYIPYNCTNHTCKEVFLSDNIDIMDMCKFKSKEAKDRFNSILGSEIAPNTNLYSTEVIPVSEDYAFVFREPSIYNIILESAVLDEDFVEKFGDFISICAYIDEIYYINKETRELQPIPRNVYQNNMKKTVKSKIIKFSKIISELDSDQYNTIIAYMQNINESGDLLTYQLPEVTCPKCKTTINSMPQEAQGLVFTRHQLAALATL